MSWVAVGVGAASVVSGLMGSSKASKAQKQQMALQKEQLAFDKNRYTSAVDTWQPSIDSYIEMVNEGYTPDYAGIAARANADVATQFGGIQSQLQRNNARMGINPNSGQALSGLRTLAIDQAKATAGAINTAREYERKFANETNYNRASNAAQIGVNQINGTAANISNSSSALANSYGNQASIYGNAANQALSGGMSQITQGLMSKYGNTGAATATNGLAGLTGSTQVTDPF